MRKQVPWAGWSKTKPNVRARTVMQKACGQRCFLGANKSFPICDGGTCNINTKGIWAAYVRAKEYGSPNKIKTARNHSKKYYNKIANTAQKMLNKNKTMRSKSMRSKSMRSKSRR